MMTGDISYYEVLLGSEYSPRNAMTPTMIPARTPPASLAADFAVDLLDASTRGNRKARKAKRVARMVWSMISAGRGG